MTYSVIREDGVRVEGLTKEQTLDALEEKTGKEPVGIDRAFITKLRNFCTENNLSLWMGTDAEYQSIQEKDANTLYIVTDDPFYDDLGLELMQKESHLREVENGMSDFKAGFDNNPMHANIASLLDITRYMKEQVG